MGSGQRKLRQSAAPAASLREKSHGLFSVVTKYPSHVIISPSGAVLRQVMEGKEPHRRTGKQTVPLLSVGKSRACWKLENHALPLGSSSPTKGEFGTLLPSGMDRHRRRLTMGNITRDVRQNIPFVTTRGGKKSRQWLRFSTCGILDVKQNIPLSPQVVEKNPASGSRFSTCGILSGKEEGGTLFQMPRTVQSVQRFIESWYCFVVNIGPVA
uniref:Uncharacterized protein n=1 Tax=Cacopsylla melanoneura TaxID=428564 RepID=A0A8D8RGB7_9HEMI